MDDKSGDKRFTGLKSLDEKGAFIATIAQFNHIDLDGDVTLPGAFSEGKQVQIAQWGHTWDALPYGIATLRSTPTEQQADGQFTLASSHGRDAYETIKASQAIQEWSYGFQILDADFGTFNDQEVRFLKRLDVKEISPVMVGAAGPGMTHTDAVKGYTFDEQTEAALAAVLAFTERAASLAGVRAKEGRSLSTVSRERISRVHAGLVAALPELEELLALGQASEGGGDETPKAIPHDLLSRFDYIMRTGDAVLARA